VVPLPPPYPPPQAEPASARSEAAIGRSFFAAKLKQFIADTVTSVISLGGARLYAPFQDEFSDDRYECRRGRQPFSRELALYESAHPVTVHQRWVTGTKVFGQRCQGARIDQLDLVRALPYISYLCEIAKHRTNRRRR
jgi:hypothetical protein